MADKVKTTKAKTKAKKSMLTVTDKGRVYISATFNNTLVTFTNELGHTVAWSSAGASGFKGSRKATPFAASAAVEGAAKKAVERGVKAVDVFIKGPGSGRESALRAIKAAGLSITMIADVTPIPHNGPRAEKKRRI